MTTKEANKKVRALFNTFNKDFNGGHTPTDQYYKDLDVFKREARELHNVIGLYEVISHKNALKMAKICSSLRFVEPFQMLIKLSDNVK